MKLVSITASLAYQNQSPSNRTGCAKKLWALLLLVLPAVVCLNPMWLVMPACASTVYVDVNSANPMPPFANWATAAVTIQDGVDASNPGDTVLVNNGVYPTGGRPVNGYALTNRVAVTQPLTVKSVNGPAVTIIQGYQMVPGPTNGDSAVRCVYLANGAMLTGFTLTNGATRTTGDYSNERYAGGVKCASGNIVVSNCVVYGNSADSEGGGADSGTLVNCTLRGNRANGGGGAHNSTLNNCILRDNLSSADGGGAYGSTLNNCLLSGNSSFNGGGALDCTLNNCILTNNTAIHGGGVYIGTLNNCLLIGNSAYLGGGAHQGSLQLNNCTVVSNAAIISFGGVYGGSLQDCIVYGNTAPDVPNYDATAILNYCCTTPLPTGIGNITDAPLFVDQAGGNLRLQATSPCVNTGNNGYAVGITDLDGRPRIVGGTVDMGAYEFHSGVSSAFIGWLQQYGLPTDGSADFIDSDSDGMNNWQEWICGTDPTNPQSVLSLLSVTPTSANATVTWQSVVGVNYSLERSANLAAPFMLLGTNIVGQAGTTSYTDTNAAGAGPFFYRVGVKSP
jgi:hypothetical protein